MYYIQNLALLNKENETDSVKNCTKIVAGLKEVAGNKTKIHTVYENGVFYPLTIKNCDLEQNVRAVNNALGSVSFSKDLEKTLNKMYEAIIKAI